MTVDNRGYTTPPFAVAESGKPNCCDIIIKEVQFDVPKYAIQGTAGLVYSPTGTPAGGCVDFDAYGKRVFRSIFYQKFEPNGSVSRQWRVSALPVNAWYKQGPNIINYEITDVIASIYDTQDTPGSWMPPLGFGSFTFQRLYGATTYTLIDFEEDDDDCAATFITYLNSAKTQRTEFTYSGWWKPSEILAQTVIAMDEGSNCPGQLFSGSSNQYDSSLWYLCYGTCVNGQPYYDPSDPGNPGYQQSYVYLDYNRCILRRAFITKPGQHHVRSYARGHKVQCTSPFNLYDEAAGCGNAQVTCEGLKMDYPILSQYFAPPFVSHREFQVGYTAVFNQSCPL